jgi:hypothetical protein
MTSYIFWLLIVYQFKHFLADYPGQSNQFMLGKFKPGWDFVLPLSAHCAVHSAIDLLVLASVHRLDLSWLAAFDFVIHFTMDRLKASPNLLGRYQNFTKKEFVAEILPLLQSEDKAKIQEAKRRLWSNTLFWNSLGVDQMVHHITDLLIVYVIATW